MRKSATTTFYDGAGEYEVEVFDCKKPKSLVICSHGNGVRRWDGEEFFYKVAENYPDHAFYLVDQNQVIEGGGSKLNSLEIMVERLQKLIAQANTDHPNTPIVILGHSMGCGIASLLSTSKVTRMIFVAPAVGDVVKLMKERYGEEILNGGKTKTKDGLDKIVSKEYVESISGVIWEDCYHKLLEDFNSVFVFEAGNDQILSEEKRSAVRKLQFKDYKVIENAPHDFDTAALQKLYKEIDELI